MPFENLSLSICFAHRAYSSDRSSSNSEGGFRPEGFGAGLQSIGSSERPQHASVNHDSGTISFFKIDYEKGLLVMSGRSVPVNEPNCCAIVKIGEK